MNLLQQSNRKKILLGQEGNILLYLLLFNVIVFIIISFINIIYLSNDSTEGVFIATVLSQISLPAQPDVFITRPWTVVTYMFTHFGTWTLISNMLWLWGFGYIMQDVIGNKRLLPVYLYGGFAGAIIFLLVSNLIPQLSANVKSIYPLIGSGPSVMAVAVGVTALAPRYRVFPMINIPLWGVTVIFGIIRLGTIGFGNTPQLLATIAGGIAGYIFIWQLQKGRDTGRWINIMTERLTNMFRPKESYVGASSKNRHFYKTTRTPFEVTPHVTQQRIDELLDKINIKGYHSLTDEEKEFLKKASKEEY